MALAGMDTSLGFDPMRAFWFELTATQKEFIYARLKLDSDRAAVRALKLHHDTPKYWKRSIPTFKRVYDHMIADKGDAARGIYEYRLEMCFTTAVDCIARVFAMESPTKENLAVATLAEKFLSRRNKTKASKERTDETATVKMPEKPEKPGMEHHDILEAARASSGAAA